MCRKNEKEVVRLLKKAGLTVHNLSDVPLRTIRHAQRGAFPDMRMAHLAPGLRDEALVAPILQDLLCTRVGFQGPSAAHYIPRPLGSYDCILIFCTEGRGWLEINGQSWDVTRNEAFLIPQHIPHTYGADPDDPWSNYWVHFQGRQAADFARLITRPGESPVIHLSARQEVIAAIEQLYEYMGQVHTSSTLVAASGALNQLLGLIQLRMLASEGKCRTAEESLDKTVEFMHRNLSKKLSLKELSKISGMSPNHFGALFNRRYEHTPMDYFNRLKIQKACELLTTTSLRISEISETLGFADSYYFSRLFRKIMGLSPRAYRAGETVSDASSI